MRSGINGGSGGYLDTTASTAATQAASAYHTSGKVNVSVNATITITHPLMTAATGCVMVSFQATVAARNISFTVADGSFTVTISATTTFPVAWSIVNF